MKYKKLTILCDLDSIAANLMGEWLARYNRDYKDQITPDDIKTWDTHLYVKPDCGKAIYNYFTPDLFYSLQPIDGAVEGLKQLVDAGHEVCFVTATPQGCADAKYQWVSEHFPFMHNTHDMVMTHRKYLIHGDVFIDDSPSNIREYRFRHHHTQIYTIAYPYNQHVASLCNVRAGSWDNTEAAWESFVRGIETHAQAMYVPERMPIETD
jgi:5'(3')-deoxyribonucleotidase